jgi:hypothetical protein
VAISQIRIRGAKLVSTLHVDNPIRADLGINDDCYGDWASDEGSVEDGMKRLAAKVCVDRVLHGDKTVVGLVAAVASRAEDADAMSAFLPGPGMVQMWSERSSEP